MERRRRCLYSSSIREFTHCFRSSPGLGSDCQHYTGRREIPLVFKENNHLCGLRHRHLAYFHSAFMYICRNKSDAWKPSAENESNFTNKVSLRGANVYHMASPLNMLVVGTLLLSLIYPDQHAFIDCFFLTKVSLLWSPSAVVTGSGFTFY